MPPSKRVRPSKLQTGIAVARLHEAGLPLSRLHEVFTAGLVQDPFLTTFLADAEQVCAEWRAVKQQEHRDRYWDRELGFVVLVDAAAVADAPVPPPIRTAWGTLLGPPLPVVGESPEARSLDLVSREMMLGWLSDLRARGAADRAEEVRALAGHRGRRALPRAHDVGRVAVGPGERPPRPRARREGDRPASRTGSSRPGG